MMDIQATFLSKFDVPGIWLAHVRSLCDQYPWAHYYLWEAYHVLKLLRLSGLETVYGLRVLEPGCASGVVSALLVLLGAEVTYLDYSQVELRRAYRTAQALEILDRVSFVYANLFAMPLAERSFDVVWNDGVIEHFGDPAQPVIAMAQYAKPGGRVLVTTPSKHTPHTWFIRAWRRSRGAFGRFDSWGREQSYCEKDLVRFLQRAGLIGIQSLTCNLRRSVLDDYLILPVLERFAGKQALSAAFNALDKLEQRSTFGRAFGFVAGAVGRVQ